MISSIPPAPTRLTSPAATPTSQTAAPEFAKVAPSLEAVVDRAKASLSGTTLADRVTPELLAAMLRFSPDGELDLDAEGRVQLGRPGSTSPEDEVLFLAVRQALASSGQEPSTDVDAEFLGAVAGARRLDLGGGLHTYVDAEGQGLAPDSPAWQLGPLLAASRRAGLVQGPVSQSWFDAWAEGAAKVSPLPTDLLSRAQAWFAKSDGRDEA